jgi:hypothetical protein
MYLNLFHKTTANKAVIGTFFASFRFGVAAPLYPKTPLRKKTAHTAASKVCPITKEDSAMVLITNIQHFLDEEGSLAELNFESIELLAYLTDLSIEVSESRCGVITGLAVPALCGASTNNIYVHTINSADLTEVTNLGFIDLSTLPSEEYSYTIVECE